MTAAPPLRLFFALPLPPGTAAALEAEARAHLAAAGASRMRVVPAARLHLTLRFLGDVAPSLVPALAAALAGAVRGLPRLELRAGEWLPLPSARRPSVLAARVSEGTGTLEALARRLDAAARALGLPAPSPPGQRGGGGFLPHITLARGGRGPGLRTGAGPAAAGVTAPASCLGPAGFAADEVVLFASLRDGGGPRYEALAHSRLGGAEEAATNAARREPGRPR
jgi:2'-5' RNA ligase